MNIVDIYLVMDQRTLQDVATNIAYKNPRRPRAPFHEFCT